MKTLYVVFALILFTSCSDDQQVIYSVHPDLAVYVDQYYAANPGLPMNLIADVTNAQATVVADVADGQNYLNYNATILHHQKSAGLTEITRANVFAGLDKIFKH